MRAFLSKHRDLLTDLLISTLLATSAMASLRAYDELRGAANSANDASWPEYLLIGATAYILMARRKYPLITLTALTVAVVSLRGIGIAEYAITAIMLFFAVYAVGAFTSSEWRTPLRVAALAAISFGMIFTVVFESSTEINTLARVVYIFSFNWFTMGTGWLLGDAALRTTNQQKRLRIQNLELEASRDDAATQAVINERLRIARELHDVVAHHVSVIGIQAGAARRTLDTAPQQSASALEAVENATREVMNELHSLVGLLREDSMASRASKQPTLDRLPALINQISDAGLSISLEVFGTSRELPASVELTAYRITQEALTNVLRHAGPDPEVTVKLRYESDRVKVGVEDDGRGSAAYGARRYDEGGGNGVMGMHERAALHGGSVVASPKSGGGWRVIAEIPAPARTSS